MKRFVRMKRVTAILLAVVMMFAVTACGKKYSPGEVDGNTYTNDWANLKVTIPSDYMMVDPSSAGAAGGTYKGFDVRCIFAMNDKVPIPMCYVMSREGKVDIEDIGEEFAKEFGGSSGLMNMQQGNTTYQVTVDKRYYTIAGESYLCFHIGVSVADVYCSFRSVDDTGVIAVCAITMPGSTSVDELYNMFKTFD